MNIKHLIIYIAESNIMYYCCNVNTDINILIYSSSVLCIFHYIHKQLMQN